MGFSTKELLQKPQGIFVINFDAFNIFNRLLYRILTLILFYALQESRTWDINTLKEFQQLKFRKLVTDAYRFSLFWRSHLHILDVEPANGKVQIEKLPLLDKEDLFEIKDVDTLFAKSAQDRAQPLLEKVTSGTSGKVLKTLFEKSTWYVSGSAYLFRSLPASVIRARDILLPHSEPICLLNMARKRWSGEFFCFEVHIHSLLPPEKQREKCEYLKSKRPRVLMAYPSALIYLQRFLSENYSQGKRPIPSLKLICTAGEMFDEKKRVELENFFGCSIIQLYAMREIAWIGWECETRRGYYHMHDERVLVEIVEKDGSSVSRGNEGEIVITNLDNFIMPFIRYRTGDTGKILSSVCDCAVPRPLLEISGRKPDIVKLKDGSHFQALGLTRFFYAAERAHKIHQYQVRQEHVDQLKVLIVPEKTIQANDVDMLKKEMESFFNKMVSVDITLVKNIPRQKGGKVQFFIPLDKTYQRST